MTANSRAIGRARVAQIERVNSRPFNEAQRTAMSTIEYLPLDQIKTDGGTQFRVTLNPQAVEDYAAAMKEGAKFPAVIVFADQSTGSVSQSETYTLADGFHRLEAAKQAGLTEIAAELHAGTQRDAMLYSLSANAIHGLARTNDDKRKAVVFALRDPELRQQSQRELARICGVTQAMVSKVNSEINPKPDKKGEAVYHYDRPELVAAAMTPEQRREFVDWYVRGHSGLYDGKKRTLYEQWGLLTAYASGIEMLPMAAQVFDHVSGGDPWLKLEMELYTWNSTQPNGTRQYLYAFGLIKPLLEMLFAAATWVSDTKLGTYNHGSHELMGWAAVLAAKGYLQRHVVAVKPHDNRVYYHLAAPGCALLSAEPLPIQTPPSPEDVQIQDQVRIDEARKAEAAYQAKWEVEHKAQINPAEEAAEEREEIGYDLNMLREDIKKFEYLDTSALIPLLDQLDALIAAAPAIHQAQAAEPVAAPIVEVAAVPEPTVPTARPLDPDTAWENELALHERNVLDAARTWWRDGKSANGWFKETETFDGRFIIAPRLVVQQLAFRGLLETFPIDSGDVPEYRISQAGVDVLDYVPAPSPAEAAAD